MNQLTKICSKCGIEKPATLEYFHKYSRSKLGIRSVCKECRITERIEDYKNNKEKRLKTNKEWRDKNPERHKQIIKEYSENNKDKISKKSKNHYEKNKEKILERQKQRQKEKWEDIKVYIKNYNEQNKEIISEKNRIRYFKNKDRLKPIRLEWARNARKNNIQFKIKSNIRSRLGRALKQQSCFKFTKFAILTGCSSVELSNYLLGLGYNPERHHIDHYIPLAKLNLEIPEHQLIGCHYLNLRPLDAKENQKKSHSLPNNWQDKIYQICEVRNINPEPIIKHIQSGKNDN